MKPLASYSIQISSSTSKESCNECGHIVGFSMTTFLPFPPPCACSPAKWGQNPYSLQKPSLALLMGCLYYSRPFVYGVTALFTDEEDAHEGWYQVLGGAVTTPFSTLFSWRKYLAGKHGKKWPVYSICSYSFFTHVALPKSRLICFSPDIFFVFMGLRLHGL